MLKHHGKESSYISYFLWINRGFILHHKFRWALVIQGWHKRLIKYRDNSAISTQITQKNQSENEGKEESSWNYILNKRARQALILFECCIISDTHIKPHIKQNKRIESISVLPPSESNGQMCFARALFIWNIFMQSTQNRSRNVSSQSIFRLLDGSCKLCSRI